MIIVMLVTLFLLCSSNITRVVTVMVLAALFLVYSSNIPRVVVVVMLVALFLVCSSNIPRVVIVVVLVMLFFVCDSNITRVVIVMVLMVLFLINCINITRIIATVVTIVVLSVISRSMVCIHRCCRSQSGECAHKKYKRLKEFHGLHRNNGFCWLWFKWFMVHSLSFVGGSTILCKRWE